MEEVAKGDGRGSVVGEGGKREAVSSNEVVDSGFGREKGRVGKPADGVADASLASGGDVNAVATIVVEGGAEVEAGSAVGSE